MPVMDGIEATRRIKGGLPQVTVIGLSMHDHSLVKDALTEAGAVACVRKDVIGPDWCQTLWAYVKDTGPHTG
jgi:CheY-like chemotaxis protein